jgi:hypothetical protein
MNVSVTMRNLGPSTWTAGQAFRLGSMSDNGWEGGRAYLDNDVPPNTDVTFTFPVTAPASAGHVQLSVGSMLQEGVQFFGDAATKVPITVLSW